jgi:radical SAM protein with 4Fe4S-binding SPASM domain
MANVINSKHSSAPRLQIVNGQLPILNNPSPRPMFGSAEVAAYGAVGLDLDIPDPRAGGIAAGEQTKKTGGRDLHYLNPILPLPLIGGLKHHDVDGAHLWIGVEDGKLIVADDLDHELVKAFIEGNSPMNASECIERTTGLDHGAAWRRTVTFLGRLAAAGFIEGIRGYHSVKTPRPFAFARLHLTQRCQLECIHCYTSSSPHLPSDRELSTERWIRVVEDFAEQGGETILFTGGEALVHSGCLQIMRRAHEKSLEVTLFSNGILIPRHIRELKEIADVVQISVDGPTAETHDSIRGPGSFKKALNAIRMLLDAGIRTRMSTTIMMNNWPAVKASLPDFLAQFEHTDLAFRISYGAMSHGRGENLDHSLNSSEVRHFVDGILNRVSKTDNRDDTVNVVQKVSGCGYAEQLVVAPDGLVFPCHLMSGALGHIDDLPIRDITRYLSRTAQAFSVDNRLGCGTCDLRHLCGGSCRVEDEKHTGSRLITTCTPEDKLQKKRFLVHRYHPLENTVQ